MLHTPAVRCLLLVILLSSLAAPHTYAQNAAPPDLPPAPHDAYGNAVVGEGDTKLNYVVGADGFAALELDAAGQTRVRRTLPADPFNKAALAEAQPQTSVAAAPSSGASNDYLGETWRTGIWGTGIGASNMTAHDIDNDGHTEVIAGGGYGFGPNQFWYILSYVPETKQYAQEWLSNEYVNVSIRQIEVSNATKDGQYQIYVVLSNGTVEVYDAARRTLTHSFATALADPTGLVVADLDHDGAQELIVSNAAATNVYDAGSYAPKWQVAYGGAALGVANVDADSALEIVTTRHVIDGGTRALEWEYADDFGARIELADLDNDGMAEIIGADDWYWINAFDADTRAKKWELRTDLDVEALHVADIDNDGTVEVVYGDGQWGAIYAHDGATLALEWEIHNPEHGVTDIAFGDVDGDGAAEVLWGAGWTSTGSDHLFVADPATRKIEWQSLDIGGPLTALDTGDVDGDGDQEIVMVSFESDSGYNDGIIFVYDARTHRLEWQSKPLLGGRAWTGIGSLTVADVDGDRRDDILVATADLYDGTIIAYDGLTHAVKWQTAKTDGASMSALAVADLDNDNQMEVIGGQQRQHTGASGVHVRVYDGKTGTEEWRTFNLTYWGGVSNVVAANLDGAGASDVIFVAAGTAYVYDADTRNERWRSNFGAVASIAAGDVDGDARQDVLLGMNNGELRVLDGTTFAQKGRVQLSTQPLLGISIADVNNDRSMDVVVSDSNRLMVYDPAAATTVWQSHVLGQAIGQGNHLVVGDINADQRSDVVVGSSSAMYTFSFRPFNIALSVDSALAQPGDKLTYTLAVSNMTGTEETVQIVDTLPTATQYVAESLRAERGNANLDGNTLRWDATLAPGDKATLSFAVTVAADAADGARIVNTATTVGTTPIAASASTRIDALPPHSTVTSPSANQMISGTSFTVRGTAQDAVAGVERVEVKIGDGEWQTARGVADWSLVWSVPATDAAVTIQARAIDRLGHVEAAGPRVDVRVDNLSPTIVKTSPAHGSQNVLTTAPLIITFSEPVDPATLVVSCQSDPGGWSTAMSDDGRTVTLRHAPFETEQLYSCFVSGVKDRAGHNLEAGRVPNPWGFVTGKQPFSVMLPFVQGVPSR